jgi:hypothetical protein
MHPHKKAIDIRYFFLWPASYRRSSHVTNPKLKADGLNIPFIELLP